MPWDSEEFLTMSDPGVFGEETVMPEDPIFDLKICRSVALHNVLCYTLEGLGLKAVKRPPGRSFSIQGSGPQRPISMMRNFAECARRRECVSVPFPKVVDQNVAHHLRGKSIELGAALE
jgi:hypothetical protein